MTFVSIVESSLSIAVLTFLFTITVFGFILIIANKETFVEILKLNSIFILFYALHMLIIYYMITGFYGQWDVLPDEKYYFAKNITEVSKLINKGYGLLDISNIYEYSETSLYLYIQGYIELWANYIDKASVLTQKLFNVFIGALIPTLLYALLVNFINKKEAFYAALIYGFFSFNIGYSYPLLRDILGAFLYILIFYFYLLPSSIKNFILILAFAVFSYFLRPETGMYALLIAATYTYFQFNSLMTNKVFLRIVLFIILLPIIVIVFYKYDVIGIFVSLMNRSVEHNVQGTSSGSIGGALLKLPIFLRLPLKFIHSQILYFPPWSVLYDTRFGEVVFYRFSEFIASIAWLHVWIFILIGVFKNKLFQNKKYEKLYFLFILSIGYIALSGIITSLPRKLIYVYPILFIVATISFLNLDNSNRKKYIFFSIWIYILVIGLYLTLKYVK